MNARFFGANLLVLELLLDELVFGAIAPLVVEGFLTLLLMTTSTPQYGHITFISCVTKYYNTITKIDTRRVINDYKQ